MANLVLRPFYLRIETLVPVEQNAEWAPKLVSMVLEKGKPRASTGIRNRSVLSVSSRCTEYSISAP